jgi:hypothetical protein
VLPRESELPLLLPLVDEIVETLGCGRSMDSFRKVSRLPEWCRREVDASEGGELPFFKEEEDVPCGGEVGEEFRWLLRVGLGSGLALLSIGTAVESNCAPLCVRDCGLRCEEASTASEWASVEVAGEGVATEGDSTCWCKPAMFESELDRAMCTRCACTRASALHGVAGCERLSPAFGVSAFGVSACTADVGVVPNPCVPPISLDPGEVIVHSLG